MKSKCVKVINVTQQMILAEQGRMAVNFWSRFKGLLFTDGFFAGQGILIKPCSSIHTIGMSYCIDVLFVNSTGKIVKIVIGMKPYRLTSCAGSAYVIEVPIGTIVGTGTQLGDQVIVS